MPESAVVVGSGPNGLAAAIVLAGAGRRVALLEGEETLGGGCRSAELTLPGFVHDTCSTVQALALASPFLSTLPLAEHGLAFMHPEAPLAHPLDDGTAVMLERSVGATAAGLGHEERAYRRLFEPLVRDAETLLSDLWRRCASRAIRSQWRGSASTRSARLRGSPGRASRGSARGRCWPAARRTRCCRCGRRRAPRSASCWP